MKYKKINIPNYFSLFSERPTYEKGSKAIFTTKQNPDFQLAVIVSKHENLVYISKLDCYNLVHCLDHFLFDMNYFLNNKESLVFQKSLLCPKLT